MLCQRCGRMDRKVHLCEVQASVPFRIIYCEHCERTVSKTHKVIRIETESKPTPRRR